MVIVPLSLREKKTQRFLVTAYMNRIRQVKVFNEFYKWLIQNAIYYTTTRTTYSWLLKSRTAQYKPLFITVRNFQDSSSSSAKPAFVQWTKMSSYFLLSAVQHTETYTLYVVRSTTQIFVYVAEAFLTYPHKFLQKLVWTIRTKSSQHLQRFIFFVLFFQLFSLFLLSFRLSVCLFICFSLVFYSALISRRIIEYRIYHIERGKNLLWHWKFCTRTTIRETQPIDFTRKSTNQNERRFWTVLFNSIVRFRFYSKCENWTLTDNWTTRLFSAAFIYELLRISPGHHASSLRGSK